jgi:hypothetical protein
MFNGSRAYSTDRGFSNAEHLKRAETNEESSDLIESRTYGSLTIEIPVEKERRRHLTRHVTDLHMPHWYQRPVVFWAAVGTERSHLRYNSDGTSRVVDGLHPC